MVRQAHTYLVGAMSGATLIAVAIAAFVVLVSAQVFRDWPIAALSGGGETTAVSTAHRAGGGAATGANSGAESAAGSAAAAAGGGSASTRPGSVARNGSAAGAGDLGTTVTGGSGGGAAENPDSPGTAPGSTQVPSANNPAGSGGSAGSAGGGGAGGSTSGAGGGGGASGGGSSPSGRVTETVNDTVSKVDETALGGTLGNAGVTGVTEGVVKGVVGPESTLGKVVDETVGALGGLLGPKGH